MSNNSKQILRMVKMNIKNKSLKTLRKLTKTIIR